MTPTSSESGDARKNDVRPQIFLFMIAGVVLMALVLLLLPERAKVTSGNTSVKATNAVGGHSVAGGKPAKIPGRYGSERGRQGGKSAEEIVADKVRQFGRSRRAMVERIAQRRNESLPPEIDAFFKAIDKGDWNEIDRLWKELAVHATGQYTQSKSDRPDLQPYWATVLDAYGAAEQAHLWPAQKLLDYGNTVMDSLRPGMVYVGGTDVGRWGPELMNETSGDPHVMITQNALADGGYMDFLRELYGDQFNVVSKEDSDRAFAEYSADAQKRLQHDLDFPDESKQVLPGENIKMVDGKVQITGQVAVMAINERILQMMVAQNPDFSFALQESFPLRGFYADAVPLGPIMELNAQSGTFNADSAAQSVDYWRSVSQSLLADPQTSGSSFTRNEYSHEVNSAANLLAAHNFTSQAEQAYQIATQLSPGNPAPVEGLAQVLAQTGRADQAQALLDNFANKYPNQRAAVEKARALWTVTLKAK